MIRLLRYLIFLSILGLVLPANVGGQVPNNKFGIHIMNESDLGDAALLVNSNGGEWGYVTLVIREDERDSARWQMAFDQMRRLKLIPIVRLATKMDDLYWKAPKEEEAVNWASFLNSLNWPVKNRYVVLFNEPNQAKEWGGELDPANFTKITKHYYETLKRFSSDFFIMPGALDLAAPNSGTTMDASDYYSRMYEADNSIFTLFDGLASHSYPNPGFSGNPEDRGKMSIRGYDWEVNYLKKFGMNPEIPVFITETGWLNGEGAPENYKKAYEDAWNSDQVLAVTPFLLSYQDKPFDSFSWKNPKTREFYPQYYSIQSMTKFKGAPEQLTSFEFVGHSFPARLVSDSEYSFSVSLKNTGQSIWTESDGYLVKAETTFSEENLRVGKVPTTEPGGEATIPIRIKTAEPRGIHTIKLSLYKNETLLGEISEIELLLVSPPIVSVFARFWFGDKDNTGSVTIYDKNVPITTFENITFLEGRATLPPLKNVIPGEAYKFILSKPSFIPVERSQKVLTGQTYIDFGRLIPLDLNKDGEVNAGDLITHFQNPLNTQIEVLSI